MKKVSDDDLRDKVLIKGLHLDISRHFLPCKIILEIISLMHKLKFNTLHLHLSDDQSFPVQSLKYPQIKFPRMLTIEDQESISQACEKVGIEIIPEIDVPGHFTAFAHIFRKDVPLEERLGAITEEHYVDMEKELPIVFDLYEEYAGRFKSKWIHMGGDEAGAFKEFPLLLNKVCSWAKAKNLKVVAWDEVGEFIDDSELFTSTLIIQRWRGAATINSSKIPIIQSRGYYLDHLKSPIEYYEFSPKKFGPNLGCIACTWSEAIDENNIWCTILPTLYMLSVRWNEFPVERKHLPVQLYKICEEYGYPKCVKEEHENSWKSRAKWWGSDPLSTKMSLDDERYTLPIFSKKLIKTLCVLYQHCVLREIVSEKELEEAIAFASQGIGESATFLKEKSEVWKPRVSEILTKVKEETKLYKNGIVYILRSLLH